MDADQSSDLCWRHIGGPNFPKSSHRRRTTYERGDIIYESADDVTYDVNGSCCAWHLLAPSIILPLTSQALSPIFSEPCSSLHDVSNMKNDCVVRGKRNKTPLTGSSEQLKRSDFSSYSCLIVYHTFQATSNPVRCNTRYYYVSVCVCLSLRR